MTEKQTRQRKKKTTNSKASEQDDTPSKEQPPKKLPEKGKLLAQGDRETSLKPQPSSSRWFTAVKVLNVILGLCIMGIISYKHSEFMYTLHENNLWFTNIKEVEREISFRTECGLYYSYYKHVVQSPSLSQGVSDLTQDNNTEHLNTINVLSRFNIYQEVLLAAIYKSCSFLQEQFDGIMFYVVSVFGLQSLLVASLYMMAWVMSGTWVAGVLASAFYIFNKEDTTRVGFVVALRENFALPFLWLQLAAVTYYFKPSACKNCAFKKKLSIAVIGISTFLFSVTWQFNQFVLLLQSMALFGAQVLYVVPHNKIATVYLCQVISMLAVCTLQFFNPMILGGFMMSFVPAAILVMVLQERLGRWHGIVWQTLAVLGYTATVFLMTAVFNATIKFIINEEADEHIYKFVLSKFGLVEMSSDFDVQLYLCNGAFEFLTWDFVERLTSHIIFPLYIVVHLIGLLCLLVDYCQQSSSEDSDGASKKSDDLKKPTQRSHLFDSRPDLAYNLIQPVFFGIMAVTTLRMKYLWTPYMCVVVASLIGNSGIWSYVLNKIGIKSKIVSVFLAHVWLLAILGSLMFIAVPKVQAELQELREFYDPDTVDLMEWINTETKPQEAFSGSMQLLAGVKLCTGRPITNHPHYEDKDLRSRTKELYQMYGKQPAEDVHNILKKYNATYIILEDSICLARSKGNCALPSIVDVSNGMIPDAGSPIPGLEHSNTKRFCDEIRYGSSDFIGRFRLVFQNKTFRVYKVLV